MDEVVSTLRRFNRAATQRIGLLAESYLGTGRSLGPARVLFEVGALAPHEVGVRVAELRRRLALDSGYLSRLLRHLELDGTVVVERDPDDGRQRVVRLTPRGRRAWRQLEDRSERAARSLVEPLGDRQRAQLAAALATAERLLRAATLSFEEVDPASADARRAVAAYFAELDRRFADGFDPSEAGADHDLAAMRPPGGTFLVVRTDDEVVGCGGVQRHDRTTGEIKRMWVAEPWRGVGVGVRLLTALEDEARRLGYRQVVLDTNGSLTEAIAMYGRAGYEAIPAYNDNPYAQHWFRRSL